MHTSPPSPLSVYREGEKSSTPVEAHRRFPWLHGEVEIEAWRAQVYAEAIRQTERRLAYARREGKRYSSYAWWAARLECELADLKRLAGAQNQEGFQ